MTVVMPSPATAAKKSGTDRKKLLRFRRFTSIGCVRLTAVRNVWMPGSSWTSPVRWRALSST